MSSFWFSFNLHLIVFPSSWKGTLDWSWHRPAALCRTLKRHRQYSGNKKNIGTQMHSRSPLTPKVLSPIFSLIAWVFVQSYAILSVPRKKYPVLVLLYTPPPSFQHFLELLLWIKFDCMIIHLMHEHLSDTLPAKHVFTLFSSCAKYCMRKVKGSNYLNKAFKW